MVSLLDKVPGRALAQRDRTVRVNGVVIPRGAIAQEAQHHAAPSPAQAWTQAARALVVRELLLQEARRIGIVAEPQEDGEGRRETDEEALVRMLLAQEVRTPEPGEDECRRVFASRQGVFSSKVLYETRHILIPVRGEEERGGARNLALDLIAQLAQAPARFDALARQYSACPSRAVGGSLGQLGPGQSVPEFETALAAAPVGRVAPEPVESRYGMHVVLVERRIDGKPLPFDLVKSQIARWLGERVFQTAVRQYIGLLAGRAQIEGIEFAAAQSPLVQ